MLLHIVDGGRRRQVWAFSVQDLVAWDKPRWKATGVKIAGIMNIFYQMMIIIIYATFEFSCMVTRGKDTFYQLCEYMYDIDLISFGPGQGDINCTSLPARLGGNEKLERKFEKKFERL